MEDIGNDKSCRTECRITRSYRCSNHAQNCEDTTYNAKCGTRNLIHNPCRSVSRHNGRDTALVVEKCHSDSCPNKGDNRLGNHRAIEDKAALTLVVDTTGHQRRLRSVEARNRTTGNGDKECRHKWQISLVYMEIFECHRRYGVVAKEQYSQQTECHRNKRNTEERVDLSDKFVDRQQSSDKVVGNYYCQPPIFGQDIELGREDIGRADHEDYAY